MLSLLAFLTAFQRQPLLRYKYGKLGAAAAALICVSGCLQVYSFISESEFRLHRGLHPVLAMEILETLQAGIAAVVSISFLSFKRRPLVELNGHIVDGQYTVSALSFWTLTWAGDVLKLARSKESLELNDLPLLHHRGRSSYLLDWFRNEVKNQTLW